MVDNVNRPLLNKKGGIFIVSTVADKTAIDDAINNHQLKQLDGKPIQEQTDILIDQYTRSDQITCYSINTDIAFNLDHFIDEVEKSACQLRSSSNNSTLTDNEYDPIFIISLDEKDKEQYSAAIKDALISRNYTAYIASIASGYSSVADAKKDLEDSFFDSLVNVYRNPDNKFQNFLDSLRKPHAPLISTGLPSVDKALNEGLDAQLYVLGAPSSIGKTTFALQLADHIAAEQNYVLYFALEMSANQLYAKTLNRLSYIDSNYGVNYSDKLPKPNVSTIMHGSLKRTWPEDSNTLLILSKALQQSGDLSQYKRIYDDCDLQRPTISKIKGYVAEFVIHNPVKPVVIIDYLQLIQSEAENNRETDKQRITNAIVQLKALSRAYHIPIIVISSFNRSAYNDVNADMTAFKESGDIDYSAEVLMTLSYDFLRTKIDNVEGMHDKGFKGKTIQQWLNDTKGDVREAFSIAKRQTTRFITLNILKNRFGAIPAPTTLITKPQHDIFYAVNSKGKTEKPIDDIKRVTTLKNNRIIYTNKSV
ncbi:DNA primase helicase [Lactobacillus amylovorus DSM 16698]|uniref:DNA primase helicase n=1 Tax=Lactobacillus amylovorus subsp. animalium DSM 16698 TaxID=695563 RepID=A0A0R2L0R7_LACAM|nr:DnaB-like helicase C-terminal domain-containing protein [Lactobacillus amylovorus]KRN92180.1 DNA primase helicase [Lactobacillus amylovorus DSM 16698]